MPPNQHFNVTAHPTAEWTLQQFREAISGEGAYRYLIHDRDCIYSPELDSALKSDGPEDFEDAVASAPGECLLRKARGQPQARMS